MAKIEYMGHLKGTGDTGYVPERVICGTTGESRRLEGFAIKQAPGWLGAPARPADVNLKYRVSIEGRGYSDWYDLGQFAGTRGENRALDDFQIEVPGGEYRPYERLL